MNFSKEQKDYIIRALEHCEVLTGGRSSGKTLELIKQQNKEIERLNTDKEQLTSLVNSCQKEIRKLKDQLQQKENIKKEVREYIKQFVDAQKTYPYVDLRAFDLDKVLEILDKESKK